MYAISFAGTVFLMGSLIFCIVPMLGFINMVYAFLYVLSTYDGIVYMCVYYISDAFCLCETLGLLISDILGEVVRWRSCPVFLERDLCQWHRIMCMFSDKKPVAATARPKQQSINGRNRWSRMNGSLPNLGSGTLITDLIGRCWYSQYLSILLSLIMFFLSIILSCLLHQSIFQCSTSHNVEEFSGWTVFGKCMAGVAVKAKGQFSHIIQITVTKHMTI